MSNLSSTLEIRGPMREGFEEILTPEALGFVAELQEKFGDRIRGLLEVRKQRQGRIDRGEEDLGFLPETQWIRDADWTVTPAPADLLDRRVEITGPVERKMMINALNSGANVFMADFEDSQAPTWEGLIHGQRNLRDAVNGTIAYDDPKTGKHYALADKTATLAIRPRGLHLPEEHLSYDGKPAIGSLVDFGLAAFHNAKSQVAQGKTPFWYLPKIEHYKEAELWNEIFEHTEQRLNIMRGAFKATVLVETFPAAFQMDEILSALRDHSAGLNCGRWDYIFSMIKTFRNRPWVLPDRSEITMTVPNMRAYTQLAIKTCHRRGAHAMGGMAAQIPIKGDTNANDVALAKVRADKKREATDGHDGTWVAHPGLIGIACEEFDAVLQGRPHQIDRLREDVQVGVTDLLNLPRKAPSIDGVRTNVRVAIQYLESWLRGAGCVPLNNLMEDAATAEISGAQVWHWVHHNTFLNDGTPITVELVRQVIDEELTKLGKGNEGGFPLARKIFEEAVTADEMPDFLTLRAYPHIVSKDS